MSAPTLLRPLAAVGLALVLALVPTAATAATATTPSAPAPGASSTPDPAPVEGEPSPVGTEVGTAEGDPEGGSTGGADQPGPFQPLAGRTVEWISTPSDMTLQEGSVSALNPLWLNARVRLTAVYGGQAYLDRLEGGSWVPVTGAARIADMVPEQTLAFVLVDLQPGIYRIRAVTGSPVPTTQTSSRFHINKQLSQPTFTTQPVSQSIGVGASAVFSAGATLTDPPTMLQGQVSTDGGNSWSNQGPVQGSVLASMVVVGDPVRSGWRYRFVATRTSPDEQTFSATATSTTAILTVTAPPVVSQQPQDVTVDEGETPRFIARATSYDSVRWETRPDDQAAWSTVAGAANATLTWRSGAGWQEHGTQVRAVFTNRHGSTTTDPATLRVNVAPPVLTAQPQDRTVTEGQSTTFTAEYTGSGVSVQWESRAGTSEAWSAIAGATGTTYAVPSATLTMDGWQYRAVLSNPGGTVRTDAATLTVTSAAPVITSHPADRSVVEGGSAVFTASATASAVVSWQWEFRRGTSGWSWQNVTGATGSTYTVPATTVAMNGWQYRAVATTATGSATTNAATLTVTPALPQATEHPADLTVTERQSASFTAGYTGTGVSVQWESRPSASGAWSAVAGATDPTYAVPAATLAMNGSQYRAVFTNATGTVRTDPATLTVHLAAPEVTSEPSSRTVTEGQPASFTVGYVGTDVSVQWESRPNDWGTWSTVAGATDPTYTVPAATLAMDGSQYNAVLTNAAGTVRTSIAHLNVNMVAPVVTGHPASRTVTEGQSASFTVGYTGSAVSVQWESRASASGSWSVVAGATAATYAVSAATLAMDGSQYRAVLTNAAGTVRTNAAGLTVTMAVPVVTSQPGNRTVVEGQSASFTAGYIGSAVSVQWESRASASGSWSVVAGAMSATYAVSAATLAMSGSQYRAVLTNAAGTVRSDAATLTVNVALPVVTAHPQDRTVTEGQSASFTAGYTGTDVTVQWEHQPRGSDSWLAVAEGSGATFTVPAATLALNGSQFRVAVTNAAGTVFSDAATLTVNVALPVVTTHPQDRTVTEGQSARFTAGYTGSAVSVQWESRAGASGSWSIVAGATSTIYTVPGTTFAMSGSQYRAVFTNAAGTVRTNPATLRVNAAPPVITRHPADRTVTEGGSTVFSATATSSVAVSWQWQSRDGDSGTWSAVTGSTGSSYSVNAATLEMSGRQLRVVITSAAGSATSDVATLTVNPALLRVTGHPQDVHVAEGGTATFSATYDGTAAPVSWQWQSRAGDTGNWMDLVGGSMSTFTTSATLLKSGQQYRAVLSSVAGSVETNAATLTVGVAVPTVVTDPQSVTVTEGEPASFTAVYGGTGAPVSVRWESRHFSSGSWDEIAGATGSTYTVDTATMATDGTFYRAVFTNSAGSRESGEALLTVTPAVPHVTEHPRDQAVPEGDSATFSAAYGGTESDVSVQWYRMGPAGSWAVIEGATGLEYTVVEATLAMNGDRFRAEFRNVSGSVTTTAAILRVDPVPPAITEHPQDVTALEGGTATFTAAYSGTEYPTVTSWQYSTDGGATFVEVPPGVGTVGDGELVVDPVAMDMQGWQFRVGFSNAAGEAWSDAATLTVLRPRPLHLTVTPRAVLVDSLPGRG